VKNQLEDDIKHLQNRLEEISQKSKKFFQRNKKELNQEFLAVYNKLKDKQQELKELTK
jgi:hypothetical protein